MTVLLNVSRRAMAAPARLRVRWRRRMGPPALVSVGLHVALIGVAVLWATRSTPIALVPADTPATVQLVMSPPGGETPPAAAPQPEKPPAPETKQEAAAAPEAPASTPTPEDAPPPTTAPPPPSPATQASDSKLTFDFASVESDTNALVTGDLMVPPSVDVKYHNRKPNYPNEAALRGEQGSVVLLIHVTPDGLVGGADVVQSSGYASLDRAAREAVLTWHFLPSVKDGQPIPAAMPMRFVFTMD
jgi:protein TonB